MRPGMSKNADAREPAQVRTLNPMPGLSVMAIICLPYLSNSMKSVPRTTGHDLALVLIVTVIWGVIFLWDVIGRKWPKVRFAIEAILGLFVLSGLATLYGTIYYLLLIK